MPLANDFYKNTGLKYIAALLTPAVPNVTSSLGNEWRGAVTQLR